MVYHVKILILAVSSGKNLKLVQHYCNYYKSFPSGI